ncbi:MAG: tRNA pseudouridine(55) synthase TruB [Dictyoglomus sp.]|nr:tRNA pseudouridine(55) synthase TruB [Dictyoglomus sp.]MCX7942216.1 tRNA pseudouridine(55) synthase TruB [Dictyoglomaceae bacterium]MDW8188679.1 tRNA pseudouridine(55) synthase TruB [Dictyoglomus sp.]
MNHFLLINKPPGITSFTVVKKIREITGIKKVGHMGTLDPRACGLMIIGLDKAVKLEEYLLTFKKTYIVEMVFGIGSETYDREAKKFTYEPQNLNEKDLEIIIKSFVGEREQIPPTFSALHIKGKRAYELARKGEEFSLPKRKIVIYNADLKYFEKNIFSRAIVEFCVSSGTYIRSLIRDIGKILNIPVITSFLLRTQIGKFHINNALPYKNLEKNWKENLISAVDMLDLPSFLVLKDAIQKVRNGNPIKIKEVKNFFNCSNPILLVDENKELLAIAYYDGNLIKPKKVFN